MTEELSHLETRIVETVRESQPAEPAEVVSKVAAGSVRASEVHDRIRSLISRGVLRINIDWKLQMAEQSAVHS